MTTNNKYDQAYFSVPRRMSAGGIWVLFISQFVNYLRAFGFLLIYMLYKFFTLNEDERGFWSVGSLLGVIAIFLLSIGVSALLKYRSYKYYVDFAEQVFVLESGVFAKEKTIIQLDKIFQVNLKQNLWQQAIDVYEVEIETAGSAGVEARIRALTEEVALGLKSVLKETEIGNNAAPTEALTQEVSTTKPAQSERRYVGKKNIVFAALFSNYESGLRIAFGLIVLLWSQINEFASIFTSSVSEDWLLSFWYAIDWLEVSVIIALFLLLPLVVNMYLFIVRYYNISFQQINEKELSIDYGLITVHQKIFKVQKLQQMVVVVNRFLRWKGLRFVSLLQTENDVGSKQQSVIMFPGIPLAMFQELEQLFYGGDVVLGQQFKPLKRKLCLGVIFKLSLTVIIASILWQLTDSWSITALFAGFFLVAQLFFSWLHFRNDTLYLHPQFIVKKSGALRIKYDIIAPEKIQNITVSRKIWKPRFGSMVFHTASGSVGVSIYDYQVLDSISEYYANINIQDNKPWM